MEQKLSDTLVKIIDRSNPMMQNLQLASRFNKLVEEGGGGTTDLIFNVKCISLANDYITTVTYPRSNKVTDIAIDNNDFPSHYNYNENGYEVIETAVGAGVKISVVYDGDTYSYTYTDRDYEQHDLIKE